MINSNRIVPVTATDLLSLYGIILLQDSNNSSLAKLDAVNPGEFEVASTAGSLLIASEPIKDLDFKSGYSAGAVYFVPAYDYAGFKVNGTAVATTGDAVEADGRSLYKATLATGAVSIAKVGF